MCIRDRTQGSRCLFRVSTDWHGLECRVRELKLLGSSTEEVEDYKLKASTAGVSDAQKAMYAKEPEVLRMLQLPGNGFIKCMRTFDPVTTNRRRVKLFQKGGKVRLAELHVYKANAAKNMACLLYTSRCV